MDSSADEHEAATVRAMMERYVEAVYQADVETLRSLFHKDAFMGGYLGDDLLLGTHEPFLADIGGHPSMASSGAPFRGEIADVQVEGRAATVTLLETGFFGAGRFVNYFGLIQVGGDWKIISKTFASL